MKKLKYILLLLFLAVYMALALSFVIDRRERILCNKIDIRIRNEEMNRFLKTQDIEKILEPYRYRIIGRPIDSVNTLLTETLVAKNGAIKNTSVYTTIDGKLIIKIEQRRPIVRVYNKRMQNYYIDDVGRIVPIYKQYAAFSLVANGNITEPFDVTVPRNLYPGKKDTILRSNIIYDVYQVARYIDNDEFWKSQIQQLYVNDKQNIILIPRVGMHNIIFGRADDIDIKFKKLKSMYRTFNVIGWNKYKTINLKYKDQVICTKY
jgi:cell division protein FtsQ